MSFLFSISEGVKGVTKARLATVLSISSITFTILLLGFFALFIINLHSWMTFLKDKIEIEVFIEIGTTDDEIKEIQRKVEKTAGVSQVEYISRKTAAERFEKEFGQNVYDILEYNPFPASLVVRLNKEFQNPQDVEILKSRIEMYKNVDEVFYKKPLLEEIDKYVQLIYIFAVLAGLILILIAMALIFNTIRLTIYARRDMIYIMRLVGATEGFVRKPFLIEGLIQGLLGGLLASLVVYYSIKLIQHYIYPYLIYHSAIFISLVGFGMLIGLISAYLSLNKYLKIIS
jgi:cell division transport system permease protein